MEKIGQVITNKTLTSFVIVLLLLLWLNQEVVRGNLDAWDETFIRWVRHFCQPGLLEFARFSYISGEAEIVIFFVLGSLSFLFWKRYLKEAQVLAISSLGILILTDKFLKPLFDRIRPAPGLIDVQGNSYPSGHISGNFMLYLYISYLISFKFPKLTVYFYSISIILICFMGWASLYLQVHWATDIIAGFCVGYLAFTLSIFLLKTIDTKYRNF
ncbi:phosphatase PAP2 family protein [cyanobacterium endosymbiont of Epithemia turgida]|uniref:phosphatase PAP2 family protein n=1 Tax=cyanobacterium endosymbiont of Epithemia turgida TaxID=718217 RepID=UPI0004D10F42|nr:phosphatase PAP2 family protein [cyanobacterium endosymbiont of Epithemia turgida]BAP17014.1 PA-phosphatase-like phosphoesterase [cyanobacterium endosymbiont of Epithemia turgida isolate EtSB Lake Yunoko]